MSQESNLEEGTREQLAIQVRNGRDPGLENSEENPHLRVEIQENRNIKAAKGFLHQVKNVLDRQQPYRDWTAFILFAIKMTLDFLFFYILVIQDDKKCIELDRNLGITFSVLSMVFDLFLIIYHIMTLCIYLGKYASKRLWLLFFFVIDVMACLLIPQVFVILIISKRMRVTKLRTVLYAFIVQVLPTSLRMQLSFLKACTVTSGALFRWAIGFIVFYWLTAHAVGGLWYSLAIYTVVDCWTQAYKTHTGRSPHSFFCDVIGSGNYTLLNNLCPTKMQNTTMYNFGLFSDALETDIAETKDFFLKFLHCIRWGLQNLSSFGQNLNPTNSIINDTFTIYIIIFGVSLFVFFIGKMQSETTKSDEIKRKERKIKKWMHLHKLSENLQKQVKKKTQPYINTQTVHVESLLNNLPNDVTKDIKLELCSKLLEQVEEFRSWSLASRSDLCDCVKPVFHSQRTCIIREGDPIDEMLFVVKGKLRIYTDDRRSRNVYLKDGDFCGEELVSWYHADPNSSNLPRSTKTIQVLTDVEAFALVADDLQNVFIRRQMARFVITRLRFRIGRSRRNAQVYTQGTNNANTISAAAEEE